MQEEQEESKTFCLAMQIQDLNSFLILLSFMPMQEVCEILSEKFNRKPKCNTAEQCKFGQACKVRPCNKCYNLCCESKGSRFFRDKYIALASDKELHREVTFLWFLLNVLFFSPVDSLSVSRSLSSSAAAVSFQQDMGLRMLLCGRVDIIPQALAMLGPEKVNAINIQVNRI